MRPQRVFSTEPGPLCHVCEDGVHSLLDAVDPARFHKGVFAFADFCCAQSHGHVPFMSHLFRLDARLFFLALLGRDPRGPHSVCLCDALHHYFTVVSGVLGQQRLFQSRVVGIAYPWPEQTLDVHHVLVGSFPESRVGARPRRRRLARPRTRRLARPRRCRRSLRRP